VEWGELISTKRGLTVTPTNSTSINSKNENLNQKTTHTAKFCIRKLSAGRLALQFVLPLGGSFFALSDSVCEDRLGSTTTRSEPTGHDLMSYTAH